MFSIIDYSQNTHWISEIILMDQNKLPGLNWVKS